VVLDDLDVSRITDPEARRVLGVLLQLVESQAAQIALLKAENQRLRDENNRLKGEQGKPTILPNKRREAVDHSSEQERRAPPQAWQKAAKLPHIRIDRTEDRRLDRGSLPEDAQFKGYAEVVVQDLALRTDTVTTRKRVPGCERWYSPGLQESYQAPLPDGYHGQFGPGVAALALYLCYQANMSQAKLLELFGSVGLSMSAGHLATLLTEQPELAAEYDAIGRAALASSSYQHLDETPTRVAGVEEHCHVLDSPLATVYRTTPGKDRQAAIDVLRLGGLRCFQFNLHAWAYLAEVPLSAATRASLVAWPQGVDLDEATFIGLLAAHLPKLGEQQRRQILDAAAIGAYRAQQEVPVVETLVVDDAPQWKGITADRALCWVHEGRHYKKLDPSPRATSATPRRLPAGLLGLLPRTGRLPGARQRQRGSAALAGVRQPVPPRDRLRRLGRAHRQNAGQEGGLAARAGPSGAPLAQQPGRTGRPAAGAETRCQLRRAQSGWHSRLGLLPNHHRHCPEARRQRAALSPGSALRRPPTARLGRPHRPTRYPNPAP